jgi:hypothetical protein
VYKDVDQGLQIGDEGDPSPRADETTQGGHDLLVSQGAAEGSVLDHCVVAEAGPDRGPQQVAHACMSEREMRADVAYRPPFAQTRLPPPLRRQRHQEIGQPCAFVVDVLPHGVAVHGASPTSTR